MSSLLRKKPVQSQPKEEKKEPKENVPAKGAPQVPKVTECAGCGDAFTSEDLTQYKQKWYCNPCLAAKKADAKASKPAGLSEDAIKVIIAQMLPNLDNYFTRPEILEHMDKIGLRVDALSTLTASNAADLKILQNSKLPATFAGDLQVLLDKVKSSLGRIKMCGEGAVVNAHRRMTKFLEGK